MISVFDYTNPNLFLRDALGAIASEKKNFTVRSFASRAGLSASYLSRVLSGQRNLALESADQIAKSLKLSSEESRHLFDLVTLQAAPVGVRREALLSELAKRTRKSHLISIESFRIVSNWSHFALIALSMTRGFRYELKWIAKRLGISALEVKDASDRLEKAGLLKISDGKVLAIAEGNLQTPHDVSSRAVQENHRQHLQKAEVAITEIDPEFREFINRAVIMSRKDIPEAKRRIRIFMDSFTTEMEDARGEEVFQMNLQFYQLSHTLPGDV